MIGVNKMCSNRFVIIVFELVPVDFEHSKQIQGPNLHSKSGGDGDT